VFATPHLCVVCSTGKCKLEDQVHRLSQEAELAGIGAGEVVAAADERLRALGEEVMEKQQVINGLQNEVQDQQKLIARLQEDVDNVQAQVGVRAEEVVKVREEMERLKEDNQKMFEDNSRLVGDNKKMFGDCQRFVRDLQGLQERNAAAGHNLGDTNRPTPEQVTQLQDALRQASEEKLQAQEENMQVKDMLSESRSRIAAILAQRPQLTPTAAPDLDNNMQALIAQIDDCVYRERDLELRLKALEADNMQLAAENQQLANERTEVAQEQESLKHEITRLQEAANKRAHTARGSLTFGEMSMEYPEGALGSRSNTGSLRSSIAPSRAGSMTLQPVLLSTVEGLQEDTNRSDPDLPSDGKASDGNDKVRGNRDTQPTDTRLEADNERLRGEVTSLLQELDQVVTDNKLLVEDNQQLIHQITELEARDSRSSLVPGHEASRGSTESSGMDYQQMLADNMKLASDNRQLLEDNNRLFSDNKKIIVDLSKLQQNGELLFRDNCKVR